MAKSKRNARPPDETIDPEKALDEIKISKVEEARALRIFAAADPRSPGKRPPFSARTALRRRSIR